MPIRISLCRNAGANRGLISSSVLLKDSCNVVDVEKIARNKLRIPKKKQLLLYEHTHGTQITESNLKQIVVNGAILNVSCGEAFLSPQGIPVLPRKASPLPKMPRWPAPFGKEKESDKMTQEAVCRTNPPWDSTIWHQQDLKTAETNDLPCLVAKGVAHKVKFSRPVRLLTTLSYGNDFVEQTIRPNDHLATNHCNHSVRSPFADLSGNMLNRFKRYSRTNKFIALRRHDEHVSVDYTDIAAFHNDDGKDLELRECRGLLLSPNDGTVLARRFHKFWNIHEVTDASDVDVNGSVLMEKLDGFLVSPFIPPATNQVRWATRQERSMQVEHLVSSLDGCDYDSFAKYWIKRQCTPLFECILRQQHKSIVSYERDGLVLLAARHMETGVYVSWDKMLASAAVYSIPVARSIRKVGNDETLDDVLDFVRNRLSIAQEIEGVVLVVADNQRRYKIKTNWYLNHAKLSSVHRSTTSKSAIAPRVFCWEGLPSAHWSEIPNRFIFEVALWNWLSEGTISDDLLPLHVQQLHRTTNCPINVLLYFIDSVRHNLFQLDQEIVAWALDDRVQGNQGQALLDAKAAGWDTSLVQTYLTAPTESRTLRELSVFLWHKIIKKSEWDALRCVLRQSFVSLSDLSTDTNLLLSSIFPSGEELDPVTIVLRGLPSSGKSFFAKRVLVPYFRASSSVERVSADDYFVSNGKYKFNKAQLVEAHAYCRQRFEDSTATIRIVDNTNSKLAEYAFYKRKSKRVLIMEIHGRGNTKRNDHHVPQAAIDRMKRRWEIDEAAVDVQNFHG